MRMPVDAAAGQAERFLAALPASSLRRTELAEKVIWLDFAAVR
ncbi:MAG: hypothetical protein ACLVDB_00435 [Anaeromassilibacillus sp.]